MRLASAGVYRTEGHGDCRLPASWRIAVRDGDQWRPVDVRDYPVARDAFTTVRFAPRTTTAIRIEAQVQNGRTAGLLEWRVAE